MASTRSSRRAGRSTADAPSVTEVDLNGRGFPGEVLADLAAPNATTLTLAGGPDQADALVGMHIRVAPKASFESGDLADAQDRIVATYSGDPAHTLTVTEAFDPTPDPGATGISWTTVVIGRGGVLAADPATTNQIVLPAGFKGAARDSFTGTIVRFGTGNQAAQSFVATAYDVASRTVTLTPRWTLVDTPLTGDQFAVYGERVAAVAQADGRLLLTDPLHPDAVGGDNLRNSYRKMQVEVVAVASGNTAHLGSVAEVTASAAGALTLDEPFDLAPGESVTLLLTGGWVSAYRHTGNNTHVLSQLSVRDGEHGVRHAIQSPTSNGYNRAGLPVVHRERTAWGLPAGATTGGIEMESSPLVGAFYQARLVCFTPSITGAFRARFAASAASAEAQVDSAAGASALTDGNQAINLQVDNGELSISLPTSSFGDLRTVPLTPRVQINFSERAGPQELVKFTTTGNIYTVRQGFNQMFLRLGDKPFGTVDVAASAFAVARSKRVCRYRPGMASLLRFSAVFNAPVEDLWQFAGLATSGNALEFGYYGAEADGSGASKFGINRARGGRLEVRSMHISLSNATYTGGVISITTPAMTIAGFAQSPSGVFAVTIPNNTPVNEIARLLAEESRAFGGTTAPATLGWEFQNVGASIIIRTAGVGTIGTGQFAFTSAVAQITANTVVQQFAGTDGFSPEVREIFLRLNGALADGTLTITLNGSANTVTIATADGLTTAADVAWQIVNATGTDWTPDGTNTWTAELVGDEGTARVRFTSIAFAAAGGTFSSAAGTTNVIFDQFVQRAAMRPTTNNWVFQENWNIDKCDGTGPSGFVLNPQKGNIYQIEYEYLGFGSITFSVENTATGGLSPVHRIKYPNTEVDTSLEGPHMPIQMAITARAAINGVTAPLTMSTGSWAFFVQGEVDHVAPRFTVSHDASSGTIAAGERRALIFLKHPEIYNDKSSQVGVQMEEITVGADITNSAPTIVEVVLNPIYTDAGSASAAATGEPAWRFADYPNSPIIYATTMTNLQSGQTFLEPIQQIQVTGGTPIASGGISGDGTIRLESIKGYNFARGDVLAVTVTSPAGGPDVNVSVTWIEDH